MQAAGWPIKLKDALGPQPQPEEDLFQHPLMVGESSAPEKERLGPLAHMARYGTVKGIGRPSYGWVSIPALGKTVEVQGLADPARPGEPEERVAKDLLTAIEEQSRRFDEMKAAFSRPGIDWQCADGGSFDRSSQLRALAYFVRDRARLRLVAGEADLAFEDVEAMADVTEILMRRGPCIVSFFTAVNLEGHLSEIIWEGIKRGAWNETQLARLQHRFEGPGRAGNFRRVMREELAHGMSRVNKRYAPGFTPKWNEVGTKIWDGVRKRAYGKFGEAWTLSWTIVRPVGLAKQETCDQFESARSAVNWLVGVPGGGTQTEFKRDVTWPKRCAPNEYPYCAFFTGYFKAEAKRTLLLTGIALERYRLKHGRTPGRLEMLVPEFLPEVPKDISDGQPLRYQVLPDGAPHVWSIWPSGKDEGGMTNSYETKNTVWTTGRIPGLTGAAYNAK